MSLIHRLARGSAVAAAGLAMAALTGAFSAPALASAPSSGPRFVALSGSLTPTRDAVTGGYSSARMSVEVALAPRHQARLTALLKALYAKGSGRYDRWLAKGQFDARFAPAAASRTAVSQYLTHSGLTVRPSASPFLVRATGSSARVSAAFRTTLSSYRAAGGTRFYANSTAVHLPSGLASSVLGVIGLSSAVREHDMVVRAPRAARPASGHETSGSSCETGYPTPAQLFGFYNSGTSFASGYGAGPGCSGLTPSQTNSIYGAPGGSSAAQGSGVTLALFELSAYQQSDISTWGRTLYGNGFSAPLKNVNVDGGPLNPSCPAGDTCPPDYNGYSGDIEVDADIETQLTIAPDASKIIVYNAPNDYTGQTTLDEYTKIAADDSASSISSSWGECENDLGSAMGQAENVVFEQMAAQGQSMFASAGDDGAFDCLDTDGTNVVNVDDPEAQPWVTSVGGTSFESDNPGTSQHPSYPSNTETVWNVGNLCNTRANEGGDTGYFWCDATGAGGGGSSEFWGRPSYQRGPGVNNPNTTYGNGTTQCSFAASGAPCREVPDISANADEFTPYAEYCTGTANTVNSVCATFSGSQPAPGWFGIGGTSLSSPLWSGIAGDRDSYTGHRAGNLNPLLYQLYNSSPGAFFHDITGNGPAQAAATNNGLFPTTPGYDEATGIGTPKMAALITESG
jgi:kumamolisin